MSAHATENHDVVNALWKANAVLYFQLARFVIWAEQNPEIVAASPRLKQLTEAATRTLASVNTGIRN